MVEQILEKIYDYADIITNLRIITEKMRITYIDEASDILNEYRDRIFEFCRESIDGNYPEAYDMYLMLKHIFEEENDLIVVADILENAIIPMAEKIIQEMGTLNQQLDEEYVIESTATGYLTIKNIKKNIYLHSNNDPMWEARKQIRTYCRVKSKRFALLGCGLGYHAYQLYQFLKGSVKIRIYEENAAMVEYARQYGVLNWIPEDMLEVVTEDSLMKFLEDISDGNTGFFMHYQSLQCLQNEPDIKTMRRSYSEWLTHFALEEDNELNFWRNLESDAKMLKDFDSSSVKEEIVIVAGGPSLDDNLERLRSWQGEKTIIAVGTVFGKLIRAGIRPDMFVIIDPTDLVARQIDGLEEETVPLFLEAAASFWCSKRYKGPKFLIFSGGLRSEYEYAKENDQELLPIGGTVTSTAIVLAVRFHAKAIYLMGVDLSYPSGISHATDTPMRMQMDVSGLWRIPGVRGQIVYSDRQFATYLNWISTYIQLHQDIRWYNLSEVGAHIEGTIEVGSDELPEEPTALPAGKISIIIPCYNAEEYLKDCVDSLLKQTLPSEMMELIFVDDDSTDSTRKILKQYEDEYPDLIKVLKQKIKSGSGAARNAGLKRVTGDYIGFVDADDYVEPDMFEILFRTAMNTKADISECGRYNEEKDDKQTHALRGEVGIFHMENELYVNERIEEEGSYGLTQRLYQRRFLEKLKLYFPERITCEDVFFTQISNYYAKTIVASGNSLYHFRLDPKSGKAKKYETRLSDRLKIEVMKVEELKRRGAYEYNVTDIEMQFLRHYFAETLMLYDQDDRELPDGLLFDMQKKVKDLFPDWKQNVLLNEKKNEKIRKICELIDYPFEKGNLEELKKLMKEKKVL